MTNLMLAFSAFVCLRFKNYRVFAHEKWPHFFVLMGLSALTAGVGHHYDDQMEWLIPSRLIMLVSLFYAVWAARLLYQLSSIWFSPMFNTLFFTILSFAVLYTQAFWPVILGVVACFGICVPSGLQRQEQWNTRSGREMVWGIVLLIVGGVWFGFKPISDHILVRHLAHVPVSAGTMLIGLSVSHFSIKSPVIPEEIDE